MGKRKETITAWLRKRISHLDYGYKHYGKVGHCNLNDEVLDHLRNKVHLSHLTNEKLSRHFSGEDTFYFAGNSWGSESLVMIDIDCHNGIGTLQGALAYGQFLKDTFFPNLYFEPSTNGKGAHGYFVVQKDGVKPEIVNDLLGQLQAYLRQTIYGFDIENVEIKGRCPRIIWGSKKGEVANYKAGTLAKIPRNALRFEELKKTTTFSIAELRSLILRPLPEIASIVKMVSVLCETKTAIPTTIVAPKIVKVSIPKVRIEKPVGSCSDKVISLEELQKLDDHYLEVARTLLGVHTLKAGRVVATVKDLAVFLMLLKWFSAHMNEDGSLPWKRFAGLWTAVYKAKDIDRAFDPKRFAALRNYLSSLNLLDWTDDTYKQGHWERGVKVGGIACKWKASDVLTSMLLLKEEKTSLAGTSASSSLQQTVESLVMLPFEQTIRPIELMSMVILHPGEQELREAMGMAA